MLVHISIDLLCMSLCWHEIRYRTFHPASSSISGLQLLFNDRGARQGQLVPAAGAAADSPDQEGLVGDKGQARLFPGGWCRQRNRRGRKSPYPNLARHRERLCTLQPAHCLLHTVHYALHTGNQTLYTVHCTMPIVPIYSAYGTVHIVHCILHTVHIHIVQSTLQTVSFKAHTRHYILHWIVHTEQCTLCMASSMAHTAHCTL